MVSKSTDLVEVEIRPGVGTLGMFKFMDYTPWYAISEFVDNSVASWQLNRARLAANDGAPSTLTIKISLDPSDGGELRIWDNAAGISIADYSRAFKPAERPPDQSTLSRYGMGMKTAACWFSDHWRVASKALGEEVERTVEFDIAELISRNQDTVEPNVRSAKHEDHWTELVLWDLNQIPIGMTIGKIKEHLAQMYRRFLKSGDVQIFWNGVELHYRERAVLTAPLHSDAESGHPRRWEKELDFVLPRGERVTGRALLFEKGEQKAAGLHLFWRGRMIKGNLDTFYRPLEIFQFAGSYRVQRLLIELDMDDFSPTVDKKDFIWGRDHSSEEQFLSSLKRELNKRPLPLLDQADQYRSSKIDRSTKKAAKEAAQATAQAVTERGPEPLSDQAKSRVGATDPLPAPPTRSKTEDTVLNLRVRQDEWQITIQLSDLPEDRNEFLRITEKPTTTTKGVRKLGIRISLSSPFTTRFATDQRSMQLLVRFAAGLALAELTAREAGGKSAGTIRRNLNELLLNVLADS